MATGGRRLSREATVQFQIPDCDTRINLSYSEVARACALTFGKDGIQCLQPYSDGRFQLSFKSVVLAKAAVERGLLYNNEKISVQPIGQPTIVLWIKNAPFEMSNETVAAALIPFGEIRKIEYVMIDPEIAPWTNGDRRVVFIMKQTVPNFLKIGPYTLMINYRGQVKTCRRCGQAGHFAADCKPLRLAENTTDNPVEMTPEKAASREGTSYADALRKEGSPSDSFPVLTIAENQEIFKTSTRILRTPPTKTAIPDMTGKKSAKAPQNEARKVQPTTRTNKSKRKGKEDQDCGDDNDNTDCEGKTDSEAWKRLRTFEFPVG